MNSKLIPFFGAAMIAALILIGLTVLYLNLRQPGFMNFFLYRARYNELIKAVKSLAVSPGESRHLKIDRTLNPATLQAISESDTPLTRTLFVERDQQGNYRVDIITVDDVHAGFAGYVFIDKPLPDNETPPEPPQEPGNTYKRVNNHWWAFYNNNG